MSSLAIFQVIAIPGMVFRSLEKWSKKGPLLRPFWAIFDRVDRFSKLSAKMCHPKGGILTFFKGPEKGVFLQLVGLKAY